VSSVATDRRSPWLFAIALVTVALDQATKHWALGRLSDGRMIDVVWTLRFSLGRNSGMAFSRAQGFGVLIGVFAIAASAVLVVLVRRAPTARWGASMALILGGAVGNLCDRAFRDGGWLRGHVIDFVDLQWFPSFNVADAAITVGAVAAIATMLLDGERVS